MLWSCKCASCTLYSCKQTQFVYIVNRRKRFWVRISNLISISKHLAKIFVCVRMWMCHRHRYDRKIFGQWIKKKFTFYENVNTSCFQFFIADLWSSFFSIFFFTIFAEQFSLVQAIVEMCLIEIISNLQFKVEF